MSDTPRTEEGLFKLKLSNLPWHWDESDVGDICMALGDGFVSSKWIWNHNLGFRTSSAICSFKSVPAPLYADKMPRFILVGLP